MTIYSLDVLLFLFGTSLLFHVQFQPLLPDYSVSQFLKVIYYMITFIQHSWNKIIEMVTDYKLLRVREEKAMAPHSSTLAWKIPWMEEPGRLQSMGSPRVGHDWATSFHFSLSYIGEGNGSPLQCSCLENPRDGGAWWAAVYGVAQSRTRLEWLGSSSSNMTGKLQKVFFLFPSTILWGW